MEYADLCEMLGPEARCNELMSEHTTMRIGGPADAYVPVYSVIELVGAVRVARMAHLACFLVGEGANLLVADEGIRGVVIENCTRHLIVHHQPDDIIVFAESGSSLADVARYCARRGLAGLEWAVDVPGSIGGAVVGNAGAYGGRMSDVVREISVMTRDNEIATMSAAEIGFGYRTSKLKEEGARREDRTVVLSVEMRLHTGSHAALEEQAEQYTKRRWDRQPPEPSAGSVFKRTEHFPAGYLIELAGLKGLRLGQAQISPSHANVIINLGGAKAQDVRTLMDIMRVTVRERFGLLLEPEIEVVGDWPERPSTPPPWKPA
jgi:UDP-N-acetylmuramate dehydrogenase